MITYSKLQATFKKAGFPLKRQGSKIASGENVFLSADEALEWLKSATNNGGKKVTVKELTIEEAAKMNTYELIAPCDRLTLEKKPYTMEELAELAGMGDGQTDTDILRYFASQGVALLKDESGVWQQLDFSNFEEN